MFPNPKIYSLTIVHLERKVKKVGKFGKDKEILLYLQLFFHAMEL